MGTKKDFEQKLADSCDNSEPKLTEGLGTSRRKFNRNVLVGSAVLLSLSNRSAWAATNVVCVSANLLLSAATGQPSAMTLAQSQEVKNYNDYYDQRKKDPENIAGDMCYEIKGPSDNSQPKDNFWTVETDK